MAKKEKCFVGCELCGNDMGILEISLVKDTKYGMLYFPRPTVRVCFNCMESYFGINASEKHSFIDWFWVWCNKDKPIKEKVINMTSEIEKKRKDCLERNKFDCSDYHCEHYDICGKESVEALKEEWENLERKRKEEEKAIRKIIGD